MFKSDQELLSRSIEVEKLRKKRFFITGVTGFFGLNLIEVLAFLNREFQLQMHFTVLVRNRRRAIETLNYLGLPADSIEYMEVDLLTLNQAPKDTKSFDGVLHFAANANLELLKSQPEVERKIIVDGTRNVVNFVAQTGSKNLIFLSSGAVYGKQPPEMALIKEIASKDHRPQASDVYGTAKVLAEQICLQEGARHSINCTIFRAFAFAGPHLKLDAHYAIGNLMAEALAGRPIVVKAGTTVRSYLYSVDAIIWILKAVIANLPSNIYNMGSDISVTMEDLAHKIGEQVGNEKIEVLERPQIVNRYVPNIDLAKKDLGVRVYTSLDQTIRNMLEWNEKRIN